MTINIKTDFKYAGGIISVELADNKACVDFTKNNTTVTIEDSEGEVADWFNLYQKEWVLLSGASLESAEQKFAKDYGINALGEWIVFIQGEINSGELVHS